MDKQPYKYNYWTMDIGTYIEICELAMKHGKKSGESMEEEFKEILEKKMESGKIKLLGKGNKDLDILTGDLREQGKKVFNLKEWERQQKRKKKENEN